MFKGVIIEESLMDTSVLKDVTIVRTEVEQVIEEHKTPWIKQWTMHHIEVAEGQAAAIADRVMLALDTEHNWYADFKSEREHFIIFSDKVFRVDRASSEEYAAAVQHGTDLGIPDYQLDFVPL